MDEIRTNVVLPADVLAGIDAVAGPRQRSRFLAEAAREKLASIRFERAADRAFGCWTDAEHTDLQTDEDMKRYLRRLRTPANERMRGHLADG